MLSRLFRRLFADRKGATALVVAITLVPMLLASITAVDMARISAARTVLQAAVDSAAIAGGGVYGTSGSNTSAISAAQASYAGSTATLGAMTSSLTTSSDSSLVSTYCIASANVSCSGVAADSSGSCPTAYQYCVVVAAKLSLNNILLNWLVPTTWLTAKGVDSVGTVSYQVTNSSFSGTMVGSAFDKSDILTYIVPTNSSGSADFGTVPQANSACTTGVIASTASSVAVPSGTGCNYALVGSSYGSSATGSLTLSGGQYVAFAFANLTGGTTSFGNDGGVQYYDNITVNGTTYSNGACYNYNDGRIYNQSVSDCQDNNNYSFSGECPVHNLFMSFTQGTGAPKADSLNIYSSAYEMLGYPPTYGTNHALTSFSNTIYPYGYAVTVQCPRWPTSAGAAATDGDGSQVPADTNITAYATDYPGKGVTDSTGLLTYPPPLQSSCSPAASYPASGNQSVSSDWWGWNPPNPNSTTTLYPLSGNSYNASFCTNQPTITSNNVTSYDPSYNDCALAIQPLGLYYPPASGSTTNQNSSTNVPEVTTTYNGVTTTGAALPDYYIVIRKTNDPSAAIIGLDPVYDNQNGVSGGLVYQDSNPGVITNTLNGYDGNIKVTYTKDANGKVTGATVTDKDRAGFYPPYDNSRNHAYKSYQITDGSYAGDYAFLERPSPHDSGSTAYDQTLPPEASLRCFNPQQNGYTSSTFTVSNNNNGSPVDPLSNPELGAIECSANQNQSFAIYWNDMGGYESDNIIYWNAATVFTCPAATSSYGAGSPSILSG
ncbi:TadE/TadG family type IV pilus assembly protein [Acidocella facilis]|uniref:TadE/TadG family type IV pilus assembly protein n=1 Tax=Acidocella facilis TaxID=525 RepID=UPI00138E51B8|nr:TadE/TadG family type IV pilus assembly protein [Acidocella facilis]